MLNDDDWVSVKDDDQSEIELLTTSIFEKTDEKNVEKNTKGTYAATLLKDARENHQQRSLLSTAEKQENVIRKRDGK